MDSFSSALKPALRSVFVCEVVKCLSLAGLKEDKKESHQPTLKEHRPALDLKVETLLYGVRVWARIQLGGGGGDGCVLKWIYFRLSFFLVQKLIT